MDGGEEESFSHTQPGIDMSETKEIRYEEDEVGESRTPSKASILDDEAIQEPSETTSPTAPVADVELARTATNKRGWKQGLLTFLSDQWFLFALGIVIAIASQVQVPAAQQKTKQTTVSYLVVTIVFLITGCTLDTAILVSNYKRWKVHVWVQAQCFLLCSAVVFGVVSATATNRHFMAPGLLVGLIFLACVPTTMSSNVIMTAQSKGNRALTVVQTTIGNFIGVFISPALVVMYTSVPTWYNAILPKESGDFQGVYRRVLMQLGLSIYVPLIVGQLARYFFPEMCRKLFIKWRLNKINSLCMLTMLWETYDSAFASGAFQSVPGSNMVFIVFMSIGIWMLLFVITLGTSLLWLSKPDVVAITYCVPAKGVAMGVPLSTTIFHGIGLQLQSEIQIPLVIYQGLQIAFGSLLIPFFRRWIEKDETKRENDVESCSQQHEDNEK